jgi:hypothetical protein
MFAYNICATKKSLKREGKERGEEGRSGGTRKGEKQINFN